MYVCILFLEKLWILVTTPHSLGFWIVSDSQHPLSSNLPGALLPYVCKCNVCVCARALTHLNPMKVVYLTSADLVTRETAITVAG